VKQFLPTLLLLLLTTTSGCRNNTDQPVPPSALDGRMDLSGIDLSTAEPVPLKGEWEFYWGRLLESSDFSGTSKPQPDGFIRVPSIWNGFVKNGKKLGGVGYATYRLVINIDNPGTPLALWMGSIHTAHRVYVNGRLICGEGTVATRAEEGAPLLLADLAAWTADSNTLEIIIQISNFHHREGGIWGRILLGSFESVSRVERVRRDTDFILFGALTIMGLFYLGMYLARRNDRTYLFFSLFCLIIALRVTLQDGAGYLHGWFPRIPWEILNKLEYFTLYLSLPLFLQFLKSFFDSRVLKRVFWAVTSFSIAFVLFTLSTGSVIHSWLIPVYQLVILSTGVYILVLIIVNALGKNLYARILLSGFLILFAATVNDILYTQGLIKSRFVVSWGLLVFIFFQAFVLTVRFIEVFNSVDRQKRQLIKTNREFQEEINKRSEAEEHLRDVNENLLLARSAIILGLAKVAEYRDTDTGTHLRRIQEFNKLLAQKLADYPGYRGYITEDYINDLYESSILHDIGKVGIPDTILLKPGKLTPEEFEIIKKHPQIGGEAIRSIEKNIHAQTFLTLGREIAFMHHERWDGTGYPQGIAGSDISLSARITALSDVYDALTTKRCYKEAFSHEKAIEIIQAERGKQFDPDVVDAFMQVEREFAKLQLILKD
jgi:response regulator RpfG family c-di-GMP phosphodiesterase